MNAGPVMRDEATGTVVVSGFEEASRVLRGTGWSSDPALNPRSTAVLSSLPPGVVLFMDPPDHTRLRGLLSPAFTPRSVERLRPRVAAVVDAVLEGLFDEADEADLVPDVASLVPLAVIAELLDVGAEGARVFREQTPDLVRMLEVGASERDLERSVAAAQEVTFFLAPLLAERRTEPGDDYISHLMADGGLTLEETMATCVLLLAAGHETTANLVANGALALLRDPEQIPHLLADPERSVAELLRVESPVKLAVRTATVEHDVSGYRVAAGEAVVLRLDAANRDPRRFPDPDRLDLTREPLPNLAFGAGHHYCLGAALARLEAAETLSRLFARHPDLALSEDEPKWRESTTFHGLAGLRVTA